MVAAEAFLASDNHNYSDIADETEGTLGLLWRLGIRKTWALFSSVRQVRSEVNPLKLNYFSTVPYRLGSASGPKAAVKFGISLCGTTPLDQFAVDESGEDYLSRNIVQTVTNVGSVCYDLKIQFAQEGDLSKMRRPFGAAPTSQWERSG